MTFQHTFRGIAGVAAVAVAMAFGSGAALAQPPGGPHGPAARRWSGWRSRRDDRPPDRESQGGTQAQHDAAGDVRHGRRQQQAAHEKARALHAKVRDDAAGRAGEARAGSRRRRRGRRCRAAKRAAWRARRSATNGWRSTAQFSPEQKAVVRDLLQKRMSQGETFRQRMRERMHQFATGLPARHSRARNRASNGPALRRARSTAASRRFSERRLEAAGA